MKRPHRRFHLLIWLTLAPATAIAGVVAWQNRPAPVYVDAPPTIKGASEAEAR